MYLDNDNILPDITQMEDLEINTSYTRRRNEIEVEVLGYCPTCNKRITQLDNLYVYDLDVYCSESCITKFIELESESA